MEFLYFKEGMAVFNTEQDDYENLNSWNSYKFMPFPPSILQQNRIQAHFSKIYKA